VTYSPCSACAQLALSYGGYGGYGGYGPASEQTPPEEWVTATRAPALRGSRLVGSRGVAGLFVCRACGSLWQVYHDAREGTAQARRLGPEAVPLFAADSDVPRLVGYLASRGDLAQYSPLFALAKLLIRRRPEGLREGVEQIMAALDRGATAESLLEEAEVDRLWMLAELLRQILERAVRGDLRPPGPRAKPPRRYTDRMFQEQYARFERRAAEGLAYLACNKDVLGRQLWESYMTWGAIDPASAVVSIEDLGSLWRLLDRPPVQMLESGTARGVRVRAWWRAAEAMQNPCAMAWNDHALYLPGAEWHELRRRLDPVRRLADAASRLLAASEGSAADLRRQVEQEAVVLRRLLDQGARLLPQAAHRLEAAAARAERLAGLRSGKEADAGKLAAEGLRTLLAENRKAEAADARSSYYRPL